MTERNHCNKCDQPLHPRREVWLELNCATGEWALAGSQPWSDGEESQGCFPFGSDCAEAVLEASFRRSFDKSSD